MPHTSAIRPASMRYELAKVLEPVLVAAHVVAALESGEHRVSVFPDQSGLL
jgi:hypothetical protein